MSTVDPESRHVHKTSHSYRDGYKAHIAVEPDTGLITATDLTPGNTSDAEAAPDLIAGEPDDIEVLGDSAYGTGEFRAHLAKRELSAVIKPPPLRSAVAGGFTLDNFDITDTRITCPAGITVALTPTRTARFGTNCATCGLRNQCTTATGGRTIRLHPHHDLLAEARAFAATDDFAEPYRQHRPLVERSIAWLVRGPNRRCRYRGVDRNRFRLNLRATAVNLDRLTNLGLTHTTTGWATA